MAVLDFHAYFEVGSILYCKIFMKSYKKSTYFYIAIGILCLFSKKDSIKNKN